MTEPARKLRRADELQLRVVLAALRRGGRFVIVVAGEDIWPEVREVLARGLTSPPLHEVRLVTGDDVIRLFSSPVVAGEGVVVIHISSDAAGAVEALNLHRDKLRQQRCRFVLRLDGAGMHERLVREAPDCYSVRDAVAVVSGRPPGAFLERNNERFEALARKVANTQSPHELSDLAWDLFALDRPKEAHRALERGILILGAKGPLSLEDRLAMAHMNYYRAHHASPEEGRNRLREALRILEPVREQAVDQYASILGQIRDSYGIDVDAARHALATVEQSGAIYPQGRTIHLWHLGRALWARGDVNGARDVLRQITSPWWRPSGHDWFLHEQLEASILTEEGRWEASEQLLRASLAASALAEDQYWFARFSFALANLLERRGELDVALDMIEHEISDDAELLRLQIECMRGAPDAIATLVAPLVGSLPDAEELAVVLWQAREKASMIRHGFGAGLVDLQRCEQLNIELQSLAAHVAATAPLDPPWSRIKAELLVADNLLARTGAEEAARAAAERALALARTGAPEQIPNCVRRIAVAALRTGAMDGLADLLDEAFAAAEVRHLPGETARLAALRLWHLTRLGQDTAQAEQAFNAAIDRTGSVLVEAEVLYQAGRATGRRDLLERSRRIYRSLPWPEREGECLEALGMKAAARTRYETFGLRLAALALERRTEPPPIVA